MAGRFGCYLKSPKGGEGERCLYPDRLDVYGKGCQHDCRYCYAKSLLSFRKMWDPNEPSACDVADVRKAVSKLKEGQVVRLGGMTDCLMPLERKLGVTKETIRMLNEKGVEYLIVTKSPLVAEYADFMDKDLAHIQVSITTTDDSESLRNEPGAAPTSERITALKRLENAGFDASLRVSPLVPGSVDWGVLEGGKLLVEFMRANSWIMKWMPEVPWERWSLKEGGYRHLPLSEKDGELSKISGFDRMSVCEDVQEHYDHWRSCFNANPEDCCDLRRGI